MKKDQQNKAIAYVVAVLLVSLGACDPVTQKNVPQGHTLSNNTLVQYVNPFIGTGGHGHTFPGATVPFGMVQLSPDTGVEGWDWCSGYHYSDSSIIGFSHTHLSGTGRGDLLDILVMPTVGTLHTEPGTKANPDAGYRSRFSHHEETAEPGYYEVHLSDYDIHVALTATPNVGMHHYTFPKIDSAHLIIDPWHGRKGDSVIATQINILNDTLITGFRQSRGWGEPGEQYWANQTVYFAMALSRPFLSAGTVPGIPKNNRIKTQTGPKAKAYLNFDTNEDTQLMVKVALSATGIAGALNNLKGELPHWDFDKIKQQASDAWEEKLQKIIVEGSEKHKTIFYTALYHAQLAPYRYMDVDGQYRGFNQQNHQAKGFTNYTVFSLWDTFRASHPLFTLLNPTQVNDFIQSMLAQYDQYGLLPVWPLHGSETNCMIGYHAVPVIVDAYQKGIRGYDIDKAYEAIKTSAMQDDFGVGYLKTHGYIPADLENKSVSKTLEYAYDDWCIAQMAQALGKEADYPYFMQRAKAYTQVFDPETGFMRGKTTEGAWQKGFDPTFASYGPSDFIEGNSWQYTWFVPHDVAGLINLMGGNAAFVDKLDQLFAAQTDQTDGAPIDITGLIGQYAHGNEPSHHVAYLYNYAGQPAKTQARVAHIRQSQYDDTPEGLSGNEDCGQMSAWYIFSALGCYPVNPASGRYDFGTPLFHHATLRLDNGHTFEIVAHNVSDDNPYIQSVTLNGKPYKQSYIDHETITAGGQLIFDMGPAPGKAFEATKGENME